MSSRSGTLTTQAKQRRAGNAAGSKTINKAVSNTLASSTSSTRKFASSNSKINVSEKTTTIIHENIVTTVTQHVRSSSRAAGGGANASGQVKRAPVKAAPKTDLVKPKTVDNARKRPLDSKKSGSAGSTAKKAKMMITTTVTLQSQQKTVKGGRGKK